MRWPVVVGGVLLVALAALMVVRAAADDDRATLSSARRTLAGASQRPVDNARVLQEAADHLGGDGRRCEARTPGRARCRARLAAAGWAQTASFTLGRCPAAAGNRARSLLRDHLAAVDAMADDAPTAPPLPPLPRCEDE